MATLNRNDVETTLINMQELGLTEVVVDGKGRRMEVDPSLPVEFQTDKQACKIVPCRDCTRPLVVTTFFTPEKAVCRSCKGEAIDAGVATVAQPVPGQTDPRKAKDLEKCLVNQHFAMARCPVHPDDDEHRMELVTIVHAEHYGPSQLIGRDSRGRPEYRQIAPGEVAMHQCQHPDCLATVSYDTTRQTRLRAMNEPKVKPDTGAPDRHLADLQGTREDRRGLVEPIEAA